MNEIPHFIWPSDMDRSENDELNRVCEYAEELLDQLQASRAQGDAEPVYQFKPPSIDSGWIDCNERDIRIYQADGHWPTRTLYTRPPSAGVPEAITTELLESIWQDGFDAESIDDRDYCDSLILARIAVEDAPQPPKQEGE